ncbi:unnamed protein product [Protopolystoma xenopodis]|uniref:Uncharacterized protein n=1 Tax=Protopolystoma xenopodis TaxID=117903 RepID=A0A448XPG5_9PLAT|nr:unnamed protein product [Protopolystoma xenopodis]
MQSNPRPVGEPHAACAHSDGRQNKHNTSTVLSRVILLSVSNWCSAKVSPLNSIIEMGVSWNSRRKHVWSDVYLYDREERTAVFNQPIPISQGTSSILSKIVPFC